MATGRTGSCWSGRVLAAVVLSATAVVPARAAQTVGAAMGAIEGVVSDATGGVLPGVTVAVSGGGLLAPRTATSAADGTYRFHALPPGEYTLAFSLAGFQPARRDGVSVGLGSTVTVSLPLVVAAPAETIDVSSDIRLIDRRATSMTAQFDVATLARLPGSRSMATLLAATPAVQLARFDVGGTAAIMPGLFSAYGTAGFNRPTIDGIVVSNILPFGFVLDYGAFDRVSVGTGAYGPDQPSPGVHVQVVTKSGGNQFTGTVYAGYEHPAWQAHNIDAGQVARRAPSSEVLPAREANRLEGYHDVNGDAGGPVTRDRLWWYVSLRDQGLSAAQVVFDVEPIETRVTTTTAKATFRLGTAHRFVGFAQALRNRQPIRLDGFLWGSTARNESVDSTTAQRSTGLIWKAEWSAVASSRLFVEVYGGAFTARREESPNGAGPRFEDQFQPRVWGGNRHWLEDHDRRQLSGSLSYVRDGWAGNHHLKVGGELFRTVVGEAWMRAFPGDVLHVTDRGAPTQVYLFEAPSRSEGGQWWYSGYASDSWQVSARTTLNLGVRVDRFRMFLPAQEHPAGRFNPIPRSFGAVANLIDWNVVAPRVGVSHSLTSDGRTIVKASYGKYWLPPLVALAFTVNPNARVWWRRYDWSDANATGVWEAGEEQGVPETRGGETIEAIDPGLELAFVREATVRLERELSPTVRVETGVVWRGERQQGLAQRMSWPMEAFTVERLVSDPGPDGTSGTSDDGAPIRLFDLPTVAVDSPAVSVANMPDSGMEYITWEASAEKRLSRRWSFAGAFACTWNRDHASAYLGQRIRENEFPMTPNDYLNTDGRGRHVFAVWSANAYGTYEAPWGISISPFVRHQAGQPFGRTLGAALNYDTIRVLAEPIGTRRQDNITLVDLRIAKDVRLAAGRRASVFVEVFNVLNTNAEQNVSWATGSTFLRPLAIVPPRIARLGFRLDW